MTIYMTETAKLQTVRSDQQLPGAEAGGTESKGA